MQDSQLGFLQELLAAPGPSGYEQRAAQVWLDYAAKFAETWSDHHGNRYARVHKGRGPVVALFGHIDEIGLLVTHVDDHGMLAVAALGGVDALQLVGQRLRILAPGGDIFGVIGTKPPHVGGEQSIPKIADLAVDVGLTGEEAKQNIPVGTPIVIEAPPVTVGSKLVSRALDNRLGAYVVLEVAKNLAAQKINVEVVAVAASQEELGSYGSRLAAHALHPAMAVAVDVTYETTQSGIDVRKYSNVPFGSGANLTAGALMHPKILAGLQASAATHTIATSITAYPNLTYTDADSSVLAQDGTPSAVVSIPIRYMHSPVEMVDLRDVDAVVELLTAYIASLPSTLELTR